MPASLSIGDFARATHMTVKTLRYYHEVGLLEPAEVDPSTGYRRYALTQIPTAQVIRRFRSLDMPIDDVRAILHEVGHVERADLIAAHLRRLEDQLGELTHSVASLRDLLDVPDTTSVDVVTRSVPATPAAVISETVDADSAVLWLEGALGELHGTLDAEGLHPSGPSGGVYSDEFFTRHRGVVTLFVPCDQPVRAVGRVAAGTIPAADLATVLHVGPPDDVDRSYGILATYVAQHAIGVSGEIREYYLVGRRDTDAASEWRTEIGWPVFRTTP